MKKIISLVIFVVAMAWTWNIIHTADAIGFETHSGIQEKLAELIGNTLVAKKPQAKDLNIRRLWTESIGDNKIRAVFAYSFTEPSQGGGDLEQVIEGEAILYRGLSETGEVDQWVLQSVKTTNDVVVFTEGSLITPGDTSVEPNAEASPTPAPTATPSH